MNFRRPRVRQKGSTPFPSKLSVSLTKRKTISSLVHQFVERERERERERESDRESRTEEEGEVEPQREAQIVCPIKAKTPSTSHTITRLQQISPILPIHGLERQALVSRHRVTITIPNFALTVATQRFIKRFSVLVFSSSTVLVIYYF